jgi:hypothetical protein
VRGLSIAGRALGLVAGGATAVLWIVIVWFPIDGLLEGGTAMGRIAVAYGLVAALVGLVAAIAAWHGHAAVIFVCFVLSFFGVGAFSLNVDHWFRVFGILDLLLLAASVMIFVSARAKETSP